jgi:hypothetical protein
MATTYKEAVAVLVDCSNQLTTAYQAANEANDKDAIFAILQLVQDEVNAIACAGLAAADKAYTQQSEYFAQGTQKIARFQAEIDRYVHYVQIAAKVVESLTRVASLAAKV